MNMVIALTCGTTDDFILLFNAGFLNLLFYVFAIGFVISLILEQFIKNTGTEEELFIVQTNRKYCWRQAWITNLFGSFVM